MTFNFRIDLGCLAANRAFSAMLLLCLLRQEGACYFKGRVRSETFIVSVPFWDMFCLWYRFLLPPSITCVSHGVWFFHSLSLREDGRSVWLNSSVNYRIFAKGVYAVHLHSCDFFRCNWRAPGWIVSCIRPLSWVAPISSSVAFFPGPPVCQPVLFC